MRKIECLKTLGLVTLLALLISSVALAQYVPPTPLSRKAEAAEELENAPTTVHKLTNQRIQQAAQKVGITLNPNLWIDDEHLVIEHATKVFKAERRAMEKLQAVLEDPEAPVSIKDEVESAVFLLVDSDRRLADLARDELLAARAAAGCGATATGGGGGGGGNNSGHFDPPDCDCDRSLAELAETEDQLRQAAAAISGRDFVGVVDAYERTWRAATQGQLSVSLCPTLPISCPCDGSPLFAPFTDGSANIVGCSYYPDPADTSLEAGLPFSVAGVIIVPDEGAVCEFRELFSGGVHFEIWITIPEAQYCLDRLIAAIEDDLGSLSACHGPTP